jgi:hypothetical protein
MVDKICVILGAGASNDVYNVGTKKNNEGWKPPLVKDLFNIRENPSYWEIMSRYTGAQVLSSELGPLIKSGAVSLENKLKEYATHENSQIKEHFKHIPPYLRDLIYVASTEYSRVPSNYVRLIINLLAQYTHEVLFVTLNYDNLLEKALTLYSTDYQFRNIKQYISSNRVVKIIKLHGSINWFKTFAAKGNWENSLHYFDVLQKVPEDQIKLEDNVGQINGKHEGDFFYYPIVTAPLAGKTINDAVCPESHLKYARQFIRDCSKYLVIGTSGLDEDLLSLLDNEISSNSTPVTHFVSGTYDAKDVYERFIKKVRAFHNASTFFAHNEPYFHKVYDKGFDDYLTSQSIHLLLKDAR